MCFFNTPGTKFELYPLDALVRDTSENDPPKRSGFAGITLAYNVKNKEDVDSVIKLVKRRAELSSRSPKLRFGADITRILPIRTDTTGRWLGGLILNLTRTGCSNFRLKFLRTRLVQRHRSLWSKRVKFKLKILLQIIGRSFCGSYNLRRRFFRALL